MVRGAMKRYFAKPDTWFKEGTECFRGDVLFPFGSITNEAGEKTGSAIYTGTYIVGSCSPDGYDEHWYSHGYKDGDEVEMNESCTDDEFDVLEKDDNDQ